MKAIFFFAACFFTMMVHAQHFSVGVRTGIAAWHGKGYDEMAFSDVKAAHNLWEKELFTRYEFKNHLALEAGFNTFRSAAYSWHYGICGTGGLPESYESNHSVSDRFYGLNLHLQYGFACAHLKGFRNYPGILLAPTLQRNTLVTDTYHTGNGETTSVATVFYKGVFQFGIDDELRYQLTHNIQVHSLFTYKWNGGSDVLRHCFSAQLGAAWQL